MFAKTSHSLLLGAVLLRRTQKTWQLREGRMVTLFKPQTNTISSSKRQERPKQTGRDTFRLRPMNSVAEMSLLHEWTTAEEWLPGVYDAHILYHQDPTGCYLAEANGIPIGGFCVARYGDDHVFGGQLIVKPAFREERYGWEMVKKMFQIMNCGRKMAIDAVKGKEYQYGRFFGFQKSWRSVGLQGFGTGCDIESSHVDDTVLIKPVDKVDFESLCDFDRKVYGVLRSSFLKSWISRPGTISFAAVQNDITVYQNSVQNSTDKLLGYGCIRLCYENYRDTKVSRRIGPLFAESPSVARCLFNALVSTVPAGTPYYIEVPDFCEIDVEKGYRLKPKYHYVRMYLNGEWEVCRDMVYGMTIDIC